MLHSKRLPRHAMATQFTSIHTVEIAKGRRDEEDNWVDNLRGYWDRVRTDKSVIYYFTEEFDAIMCKLTFQ